MCFQVCIFNNTSNARGQLYLHKNRNGNGNVKSDVNTKGKMLIRQVPETKDIILVHCVLLIIHT